MKRLLIFTLFCALPAAAQTPDWSKVNPEAMSRFQALVRIDSTDPPGNETRVTDYLKTVLDAEGIPSVVVAKDPARANLIARLKGNGSKRPLLIMGHTDTVRIDAAKWTFPPFSATIDNGWVYGRGTLDDKSDLFAALMTMVLLKRSGTPLDRDVIFVAEAGEEAATGPGIEYLVAEHWPEIDAEICLAEAGGVHRVNGKAVYAVVETTEKQPRPLILTTHGPYFEKLANVSSPEDAARYKALFDPAKSAAARDYLAENNPIEYSMLHTSISPNIFQAGYQVNVIPSEAQATLDVRALPDENMPAFIEMMRKVINDPAVEITPQTTNQRPGAAPSRIDTDAYHALEAAYSKVYSVPTLPLMQTGATDMAFLRAKGVQCYGIGAMTDIEDAPKGFGAHSDQERILVDAVYKHLQFFWEAVTSIAGASGQGTKQLK
jgi:acetylornithine deacetylase/succinyl-diaminopimelate desuccinylase-like protein